MIDYSNFSIDSFHNANIITSANQTFSTDSERFIHLKKILTENFIDGCVLEFGVYKGATINTIAKQFPDQKIWGFDSFEGLPEDWATQSNNNIKFRKGHFSLADLPTVGDNVCLVKGWFNQTIPDWLDHHSEPVKLLHIDCDLYSSTKDVLFLLNSIIAPGTVIVFDDMFCWNNQNWYTEWENGEYLALKEWLQTFGRSFVPLYRNNYMQCSLRVVK